MALALQQFKSRALYTSAGIWLLVVACICLCAMMVGFVAATFPIKLAVGLGGLIGVGGVFLFALMTPDKAPVPEALMRRVLSVLLFMWVVWPLYVTYKLGPLPALNPSRVLYWALLLLFVFWMAASRPAREQLMARCAQHKSFVWLFLVYFAWQVLCGVLSDSAVSSMYFLFKGFAGGVCLFFVALWLLRDQRDVENAVMWILVAAVACAFLGVAEMYRGKNLFISMLPTDPEQLANLAWVVGDKLRNGAYRVSGSFASPLTYAEYMLMCIPMAAYMAVMGNSKFRRLVGFAVLPLAAVSIYISHTRSSIIGAGMLFVMIFSFVGASALRKRNNFLAAIMGAFTLCCVVVAILAGGTYAMSLAEGRNREEAGSTNARFVQMQRGMQALAESPVIGVGPGGSAAEIGVTPGGGITVDNYYLNVVVDTGILGLLLFCAFFFLPIIVGLRLGMARQGPGNVLALAFAGSLFVYALQKVVLSLSHNLDFAYIIMAMLFTLQRASRQAAKPGRSL